MLFCRKIFLIRGGGSKTILNVSDPPYLKLTRRHWLQVSLTKTEVLFQPAPKEAFHQPHIRIEDTELKSVQQFKYLGCLISSDGKIDKDIENRLAKASCAFGRLQKKSLEKQASEKRNKDQRLQSCGPHNVALRVGVVGFLPTPPPSTGTFPPALSPHNFKHQMV